MEPSPDPDVDLGDPRRHVWLLVVGVVMLIGVGYTVYRARAVTVPTFNERARAEVLRAGVDPSRKLPYEHHFLFPSNSTATIAEARLRQIDPEFTVSAPTAGESGTDAAGQWELTVEHTAALDVKAIDALTRRLEALATSLGGVYGGWTVDLSDVPRAIVA